MTKELSSREETRKNLLQDIKEMRRGIELDRKEIEAVEDNIDREKMNPEANKIIAKLAQNKQRPTSVQNELSTTANTRVMSGSLPSSMPQRGMSTRIYGKIDEDDDSSDDEEAIGGDPVAPANAQ